MRNRISIRTAIARRPRRGDPRHPHCKRTGHTRGVARPNSTRSNRSHPPPITGTEDVGCNMCATLAPGGQTERPEKSRDPCSRRGDSTVVRPIGRQCRPQPTGVAASPANRRFSRPHRIIAICPAIPKASSTSVTATPRMSQRSATSEAEAISASAASSPVRS